MTARTGAIALGLLGSLSLWGCASGDPPLPQLSSATPASFTGNCSTLTASLASLPNTTITASNTIAAGTLTLAGQPIAEHCQVTGRMFPRTGPIDGASYAIGFEMRLPKNWNGRFWHQGNGGIDGSVVTAQGNLGGGPTTNALLKGFAVLSSDAGHSGPTPSFGIDPQARLDYGYQAVAKLTPMAKSLIATVYGKGPDRSYFGGCSNGGRHAMVAASRLPDQYDGIVAGAPGFNLPKAALANIAGAQLYAPLATTSPANTAAALETAFTLTERKLLGNAVLAKCDALDGATDGMIQDVTACQAAFSLANDVPTCAGARDGTCLSAGQKVAISQILAGPTTQTGQRIYTSFPYDVGLGGAGIASWEFDAPLNRDAGAVGVIFKVPPSAYTGFNGPAFTLNADLDALLAGINATDATYTESAMSFMTPPNPTQLGRLKDRGAKMLLYHGVSDAIFSVNDTEVWWNAVNTNNNGNAASFTRLFKIPGMGHCSGGPAVDQFDMVQVIVDWVEGGNAPDRIVASARGPGNVGGVNADVPTTWAPNRTRPLCRFPLVARYNGVGSLEDAASFTCR